MKKVTWDELANLYDKCHTRRARTLPMEQVFKWAEQNTAQFYVDKEGYLYFKEKNDGQEDEAGT